MLSVPSAAFLSAPPFFKGMPSAAQKCSPKDVLHISRPLFRTSRREIFKFAADADSGETRGEDEGRSMHSRPSQPMEAVSRQGEGEREDTAGSVGISFFPDPSRGLVVSAVAPYSAARMLGCQPGDVSNCQTSLGSKLLRIFFKTIFLFPALHFHVMHLLLLSPIPSYAAIFVIIMHSRHRRPS